MSSNVTPAGFYGGRQFGWIQYRKLDSFPLERLGKTLISSVVHLSGKCGVFLNNTVPGKADIMTNL